MNKQSRAMLEHRNGFALLAGLSFLGWLLIFWSVANMSSPVVSLMMPMTADWAFKEMVAVWLMWSVMMGAMMLPSAIPMMMVQRRVAAKMDPDTANSHHWFLVAYLSTWALFSVAASFLQWGFQRTDVLSHMLMLHNTWVAGTILIAAGVFQFTPIKAVCLRKCRSPMGFLLTDWRPGRAGAFRMGLKHGKYCVGCCWALMMVLFVGGVMSITAIAALASIVLLEKLMPRGKAISRAGGLLLIAWGLWLIYANIAGDPHIV